MGVKTCGTLNVNILITWAHCYGKVGKLFIIIQFLKLFFLVKAEPSLFAVGASCREGDSMGGYIWTWGC